MSSNDTVPPTVEKDQLDAGLTPRITPPDLSRRLSCLLEGRVGKNEPGAAIGVYLDGTMIASAVAGLASLEHRAPLALDTPTDIASVSKQVSAATILVAARDGLVDLDTDVRSLVPEIPFDGVTLRHCLQHTSGLPDYLAVGDVIGLPPATVASVDTFLELLATMTEPDFAPGTNISYSNTGYVVAALATERQTGIAFPELISANVLEPLEMNGSTYKKYIGQVIPGMAFSYSPKDGGGFLRREMGDDGAGSTHVRCVNGDGDLFTTISDFARWHGFLLDGRILGDDIREQLMTQSVLDDGTITTYGMGISHEKVGGVDAYGHSGSMWGYTAYSLTDLDSGLGVAVFSNRDDLGPMDLAWRSLRLATDTRALTGPWYSAQSGDAVGVCLRADGGLDLGVSGDREPFAPSPDGSWQSPLGFGSIRLVDETLEVVGEFGKLTRFQRMTPGTHQGVDPTGCYREPFRGGTIVIRNEGDGVWMLGSDTVPSVALRSFGTSGSIAIFQSDIASLHVDGDTEDVTLLTGTTSVRLAKTTGAARDA